MKITLQKERVYIPTIGENLTLPKNEQVRIRYRKPNKIERDNYRKTSTTHTKSKEMRIDVDIDTEAIIKSHVLAVENLAVEADGETRAVTTGADLLTLESAFCTQLVELVSAEIMSFDISEEMLKN